MSVHYKDAESYSPQAQRTGHSPVKERKPKSNKIDGRLRTWK